MIEINLIPSVKRDLLRARSIRNRVVSVRKAGRRPAAKPSAAKALRGPGRCRGL